MSRPINIPIASDTREFASGIKKGVIAPLEDAAESLDDVRKEGDKAGDRLEKAFADARDKVSDFKREQAETARETSKKWRAAGDDVGDSMKKGTREAEEGVDTLKENVGSNAKEMAASFDGSIESMSDGIQGLIAEMTEGFGPAGLAAGVIAAAGIGLAVQQGQKTADALNDAKERAVELAQEIHDAGGDIDKVDIGAKMREWGGEIGDNVEWFEFWQREALTNMDKVAAGADKTGIGVKDMFRAMSGLDADASKRVIAELDEQIADLQRTVDVQDNRYNVVNFLGLSDADGALAEVRNLRREIMLASGLTEDAIRLQDELAEVTAEYTAKAEAAAAAEQARSDAIGSLQGEIDGAIGAYAEFTDAETGATDPGAFIANMDARRNAVANFNGNVQTLAQQFGLSQEEMQYVLDQGLNFAPMLQSIIDSGMQGQFAEQVRLAVGGGQDILNQSGLNATVSVKADQEPAEAAIQAVEDKDRRTEVKADAKTDDADRRLNDIAARERVATITARLDSSRLDSDLAAITNRARSITITARVVDQSGRVIQQ